MIDKNFKNKETLIEHIADNLSIIDIARKYNISSGTISYWLKKYNIKYSYPVRSEFKNKRIKAARIEYALQYLTNKDWLINQYKILKKSAFLIAKELNVGQPFVSRWIKNHNIESNGKGFAVVGEETLQKYAQQKRNHFPKELYDKNFMENLHIKNKKSIREIALLLNVTHIVIKKKLIELGIELRENYSSYEENAIATHYKNQNIIKNYRKWNKNYPKHEIDIYLVDYKLGIEYHGLYWHSYDRKESHHEKFKHQIKYKSTQENEIHLLQIFEPEWKNSTKCAIWKSIIDHKIGKSNKIYARKCELKEVDSSEANKFLENNHLQGKCISSINLGLYYNNELISLMTFGKSRYDSSEYELLRFCNLLNISVVGGASKLLNYFEEKYLPKSLKTYADLRYSNGNLYRQLKFKELHISPPNYFYYKRNELIKRYAAQKHKLKDFLPNFDENITEYQNMFNNGYRRVWDAGNLCFLKTYK